MPMETFEYIIHLNSDDLIIKGVVQNTKFIIS